MIDKKKLKEYGFIQFNIKDVDENLYNELSDIIEEGPEKYQEDLKIVRTSFLESYDSLSNIHELLGDTNGYQIEMLGYDERENGRLTKLTVSFKSFDLAQEFRNRINKPHRTFEECFFLNMGLPEQVKPSVYKIFEIHTISIHTISGFKQSILNKLYYHIII